MPVNAAQCQKCCCNSSYVYVTAAVLPLLTTVLCAAPLHNIQGPLHGAAPITGVMDAWHPNGKGEPACSWLLKA